MTSTGPNDARHVVWNISELFFVFFIVNYLYRLISMNYATKEGGDDENGPERRKARRLGHR